MNQEVIKAQEDAYELWGKHVSSGMLLYPNEYLTRYIYANRKEFKTILDFGCGDGRHLEMMARAGLEHIIGVDCNRSVLDVAKQRCQKYDIKCDLYQNNQNILYPLIYHLIFDHHYLLQLILFLYVVND